MPSEKEIEEAIKVANTMKSNIWEFPKEPSSELGRLLVMMADAYLSMKAELDKYKADCELLTIEKQHKQNCYDNLKESARQNDIELHKEIDKYKAIVEADTKALNQVRVAVFNSEAWWMDCPDRGGIDCELVDKALALREKES